MLEHACSGCFDAVFEKSILLQKPTIFHFVVEDKRSIDRHDRRTDRNTDDEKYQKRKTHSHSESRKGETRASEISKKEHEREHTKQETEEAEEYETRIRLNEETNSEERNCENTVMKKTESKSKLEDKEAVHKFAKHSSQETVMSARERFLARKKTRVVVLHTGSDEDN